MEESGVIAGHVGRAETEAFLAEIQRLAPWETWAAKLAGRKQPEPLHKLVPQAKGCPLLWSAPLNVSPRTRELLEWLYHLRRRKHKAESPSDWTLVVNEALEAWKATPTTIESALELLAWAHGLPRLAVRTTPEAWSALFAELVNVAQDAEGSVLTEDASAEEVLVFQLTAAELPLSLAYIFPKIELCAQLAELGRRALANALIGLLDGEGIPHARLSGQWRGLLGCWTRCFLMERRGKRGRVDKDARLQYEWLVRQSIRWRRSDGSLCLQDYGRVDELLTAAVEIGGDPADRELLAIQQGKLAEDDSEYAVPRAGEHSEWAETAILRTNWSRRSPYLAMNFDAGNFHSELGVDGTTIWSGDTRPEVSINGHRLEYGGEWDELCWFSDDDVDYIELEIDLARDWRIQRQLLLAREDQFLFMADALLGPDAGQIDYRLELPTTPEMEWVLEDETTDVQLTASKPLGWIMPLALNEWRSDSRFGKFNGRVLHQTDTGRGLYAPLFLDLNPGRRRKARTWRSLTVAENLQLQPRDVAVAYRVQIGKEQWVMYRSLGPAGNRTFLGQNLTSEFLIARFDLDGEIENLVEIE